MEGGKKPLGFCAYSLKGTKIIEIIRLQKALRCVASCWLLLLLAFDVGRAAVNGSLLLLDPSRVLILTLET